MRRIVVMIINVAFITQCCSIRCAFRYTEEYKNYPRRLIDRIVKKPLGNQTSTLKPKEFLCNDGLDPGFSSSNFRVVTRNRFGDSATPVGDEINGESLCLTVKKVIRPKALPSIRNNEMLTVINHGEFIQTVAIEECKNPNRPCMFQQNFPLGYTTKCRQKYLTHSLKVLNAARTELISESIYYPSGCECKVYSSRPRIRV